MRIVAGTLRGRPIAAPDHDGLRPTSDRVREAVFNILSHGVAEFEVAGAHVLDLFAGTGALGLEALSRGAAYCLFVEHDAEARGLIRRNVEAMGLGGVTRIFRRDATDLGPAGRNAGFTLAFCDPPYGQGLGERALASAAEGGWLAPGALVVLEERAGTAIRWPDGYSEIDHRSWGHTQVTFARFAL
jgi:16S rRNA (guanine966-N2)-methyltransferase